MVIIDVSLINNNIEYLKTDFVVRTMMIDVNENIKRAKVFCENKIYTFVLEFLPNGTERYWTGFIINVHTDLFEFFDVIKKQSFPIIIDKCSIETAIEKKVTESEAREIYYEWRKKNGA